MNHNLSSGSSNTILNSLALKPHKPGSATPPSNVSNNDFRDALNEVARSKAQTRQDQLQRASSKRADQQAHVKPEKTPPEKPGVSTRDHQPDRVDRTSAATKAAPTKSEQVSSAADNASADVIEPTEDQVPAVIDGTVAGQVLSDTAITIGLDGEGNALSPLAPGNVISPVDEGLDTITALSPLEVDAALAGDPTLAALTPPLTPSGTPLPPLAADRAIAAAASAGSSSNGATKSSDPLLTTNSKNSSQGKPGAEPLLSMDATDNGLMEAEGELSLDERKTPFSQLLASVTGNSKDGQPLSLEQALAKTSSLNTPVTNDAASRTLELQAPGNRGFVVQTGVTTTLGQPRWGQAVGERVLWLAAQNVSSAELRLDPPELGPMQVRITIQNDQATVSFSSPHPLVREALDQSATRLREMFNEQGLNLTDVDVSDQSFARQQAQDDASDGSDNAATSESDDEETLIGVTDLVARRLVDHYA